jgi:hypothetical protein
MARIQAQIDELNRDFNNRFTRPIPQAFNNVATSPNFRFVLAQRDPNGNPTNGVTRTGVANNSFCVADIDNEPIKRSPANGGVGVEPWNTNQYLNIWVCNLRLDFFRNGNCIAGLIEYANFPDNSISERHGVVYDVDWFGSGAGINDNIRRRGTTLAHEVGHYFNLRHIWGDDQGTGNRCDGVDEINDTPNQEIAIQPDNLPQAVFTNPNEALDVRTDDCSTQAPGIMYMNYMDYSGDAHAMFTALQAIRMRHTARWYENRRQFSYPTQIDLANNIRGNGPYYNSKRISVKVEALTGISFRWRLVLADNENIEFFGGFGSTVDVQLAYPGYNPLGNRQVKVIFWMKRQGLDEEVRIETNPFSPECNDIYGTKSSGWFQNPFELINNSCYRIKAKHSNMYLQPDNTSAGAGISQRNSSGSNEQIFKISSSGDSYSFKVSKSTNDNLVLDVVPGQNYILVNGWSSTDNQRVTMRAQGPNLYSLSPRSNTNANYDVEGANNNNGARVMAWYISNDDNQRFYMENTQCPNTSPDCNFAVSASSNPNSIGCGGTSSLSVTCSGSGCSGVSYAWNGNGNNYNGSPVSVTLPNTNGIVNYTLTASKAGCANSTASTTVTVSGCAGGTGGGGGSDPERTEGGTASDENANNPVNEGEAQAFDNTTNTKWLVFNPTGNIIYDFAGEDAYAINRYTIASANDESTRDPKSWFLEGSNNNSTWTIVDSRSSQTFGSRFETKTYIPSSTTTAYKQYRLRVTENAGSGLLQIAEIQMFGSTDGGTGGGTSPSGFCPRINPSTNGWEYWDFGQSTWKSGNWFAWDAVNSRIFFAVIENGLMYASTSANSGGTKLSLAALQAASVRSELYSCFTYGSASRISSNFEEETEDKIAVYPNPTTGKVKIVFSLQKAENVWLNLYDTQGKSLDLRDFEGKAGRNEMEYDLQNYPSGAYFIDLQYNQRREIRKVMKVN